MRWWSEWRIMQFCNCNVVTEIMIKIILHRICRVINYHIYLISYETHSKYHRRHALNVKCAVFIFKSILIQLISLHCLASSYFLLFYVCNVTVCIWVHALTSIGFFWTIFLFFVLLRFLFDWNEFELHAFYHLWYNFLKFLPFDHVN